MKVSVKELAYIKEAKDIELKNLNIFIGKNGTGKTYFAKLIYFLNSKRYKIELFDRVFKSKMKESFEKREDIIFSKEEQEQFLLEFNKLIKNNFYKFINIEEKLFKSFDFSFSLEVEEIKINFNNEIETLRDYKPLVTLEFIDKLFANREAHYLPAARANYMITYKYLFDSQFDKFRNALLNKSSQKDISILPEIEYNFLKDIYQVDTKLRGDLHSIGLDIEKKIFKNGKLSIRNPQSQELPTYEYKMNNLKESIDLVAVSSSITELSPLIMYFRYKIMNAKKEMLIIDEPELSLHPDAQAKLVAILIKAVNKGLKIILVTHSPYIIEAVNNHLQRYKIDSYKLDKEIKEIEPINPNNLSGYLFEDNDIKSILDKEIGLLDDNLLNSFNSLNNIYDKMRDIEWDNKND